MRSAAPPVFNRAAPPVFNRVSVDIATTIPGDGSSCSPVDTTQCTRAYGAGGESRSAFRRQHHGVSPVVAAGDHEGDGGSIGPHLCETSGSGGIGAHVVTE